MNERAFSSLDLNVPFQLNVTNEKSEFSIADQLPVYFPNDGSEEDVDPASRWFRMKHRQGRIHEPGTIAALLHISQQLQTEVQTIFDVGALFGYFSLLSKSFFPWSEVVGFEMNRRSFESFSNVVEMNRHLQRPSIKCVNVGLSDNTSLSQHVSVEGFKLKETAQAGPNSSQLNILRLDDYCALTGLNPDLIKIDVEGYQAKIIPGAHTTISEAQPIVIMEFDNQIRLSDFGATNQSISRLFYSLDYTCYWCENPRSFEGTFTPLTLNEFSRKHEVNSLAVFVPPKFKKMF